MIPFGDDVQIEHDGQGLILSGGAQIYKKVGTGLVTRLAAGDVRMQVENNAGTILGTYWDSGNLTNLNQLTNGPGYITAPDVKEIYNWYSARPTDCNLAPDGLGGLRTFKATSSMTANKPPQGDSHILHLGWDNTGGWDTQIASKTGNSGAGAGQLQVRGQNNGTWGVWRTIWDSGNLTNLNQLTNGPGYITGNQAITLSGVVTGSGATSITTSIADAALSIAKTSGLQAALNDKVSISASRVTQGTYVNPATDAMSLADRHAAGYGTHFGRWYNIAEAPKTGYFNFLMLPETKTGNTHNTLAFSNTGAIEAYIGRGGNNMTETWRRIWTDGDFSSNAITYWNAKQEALGYTPVNKAGDSNIGSLTLSYGNKLKAGVDIQPSTSANDNYNNAPIVAERAAVSGTTYAAGIGFHNRGVNAAFLYYDPATSVYKYNRNSGAIRILWDDGNLTNLNQLTNGPGYITASGNAATATAWKTARALTIGNTGKSVDGSANVSWSLAEIGAQSSPINFSGHASSPSWVRIASISATSDWASYSSCFRASNRRGTFELFLKLATAASVAPTEEQAVSIGAGDDEPWRIKRTTGAGIVTWDVYFYNREYASTIFVQQTTEYVSAMTETYPGNYVTTDPGAGSWTAGIRRYAVLSTDNAWTGSNVFSASTALSGGGTWNGSLLNRYSSGWDGKFGFEGNLGVSTSALFHRPSNLEALALSLYNPSNPSDSKRVFTVSCNDDSPNTAPVTVAFDVPVSLTTGSVLNGTVTGAVVLSGSNFIDMDTSGFTLPASAANGTLISCFNFSGADRSIYTTSGVTINGYVAYDGASFSYSTLLVATGRGYLLQKVSSTRWVVFGGI